MVSMPAHTRHLSLFQRVHARVRGLASAPFFGLLLVGLLAGCGGSGGEGSAPGDSGNTVSGTAATGAPIVSGTVTIKDSAGATANTTTKDNGNYSIDVGAMRFPLMLKAQPNVNGAVPLFSAALASGTANITPLTTLQVFEAVGRTDPSEIYNSGDFSKIGQDSLDQGKSTVTSNLATLFVFNGLDPTTVNPITIPMAANGVGMDAILDKTTLAVIGNTINLTDRQGGCIPYGGGLTLGIDGMAPQFIPSLLGFSLVVPFISFDGLLDGYVQTALDLYTCVPGIPVSAGSVVTDGHSESYYKVAWTREPNFTNTRSGVDNLKANLRLATFKKRLPINIVAHSWGTVIAYIALTELADPKDKEKVAGDELIKVDNLITMGSPIQCLPGDCILLSGKIQAIVPQFIGLPIRKPSNVTTWKNFWNKGDAISAHIPALNNDSQPVPDICTTPATLTGNIVDAVVPFEYLLNCHKAYFQNPSDHPGSVLPQIESLIKTPHANVSSAPAVLPPAFALNLGSPYCDLSNPPRPAVTLTYTPSDGVVNYRVFLNDSAIGVNLVASQLSFINNLGLGAGQTYSYKVRAMNVYGATWSNTAQVTIPADVCSLNFTSPILGTITTSTVGYQPTLTASGNVTQVSFSWSGVTNGSATWVKNDANWLSKVTANPDGTITLRPVVTQSGDPSGTTNWIVTLHDSTGATKTQSFTVNYQRGVGGETGPNPPPPVILSAEAPVCDLNAPVGPAVRLNWSVSSNATSYEVFRNGGLIPDSVSNTTLTFYNSIGLTAGQTYTYKVVARNVTGTTDSNTITVSIPSNICGGGGTAPSPLPGPFAITIALSQCDLNAPVGPAVRLNWSVSSNATSYEVFRNGGLIPDSVSNTTLTFYNSIGLTAGQTYTYKVVARNVTGTTDSTPNSTSIVQIPSNICGGVAPFPKTVTVANTGGIGLNLRNGPGDSFSVLKALPDGTQMSVVAGPTQADGFSWWNLTGPSGTGWSAVAEWLTPATPTLNSQVTVTFTGNIGLRLRQCAGVTCTLITTLQEGTVMTVIAGPVQADGYTWWRLTGSQGTGWSAVGNWLVPNPRS